MNKISISINAIPAPVRNSLSSALLDMVKSIKQNPEKNEVLQKLISEERGQQDK